MKVSDIIGYAVDGSVLCPDCADLTLLANAEETTVIFEGEFTCDDCLEPMGGGA